MDSTGMPERDLQVGSSILPPSAVSETAEVKTPEGLTGRPTRVPSSSR